MLVIWDNSVNHCMGKFGSVLEFTGVEHIQKDAKIVLRTKERVDCKITYTADGTSNGFSLEEAYRDFEKVVQKDIQRYHYSLYKLI